MNITLQRAENLKNMLVEISTKNSKIIIDSGVSLDENEVLLLSEVQELYSFDDVDAVFLSGYGTDHVTMTRGMPKELPVYAGKLTAKIATAAENFKAKKPYKFAGYYANGATISVGDILVTPILIDDIQHEGYMLIIEGEGKRVLYSGDYRAHGRKSFEEMLSGLKITADVLICRGGVLSEADINPITERDLEEQAVKLISEKKGPVFVLNTVTDFDRTETLFRVAKRNKRVFLEDLYMSVISSAAGKAMPNPTGWTGVRAYLTTGYKAEHIRYKMFTEMPRVSKAEIAVQKFVMCIRPSMKKYMKTMAQEMRFRDGVIINALPDEASNTMAVSEFLEFAKAKGLEVHNLRKSGHANAVAIKALIEVLKPTQIIPLEQKNAAWFAEQYPTIKIVAANTASC